MNALVALMLIASFRHRDRPLPGGVGAPRGTVTEYAIDLFIQAPGENVHVVRAWRQFKEFWVLIQTIGREMTPAPTLPRTEQDLDSNDLQQKLANFVTLVLRKTPANFRLPLERFLMLCE